MDNILITQIGEDGDNNAFFPSPGGGKICTGKDGRTFVVYANASGTTITMSYDGQTWNKGQILPLSRPYMVVDSGGFIHIAGLGEEGIWYFQSLEPNSVDHFSDGERIYPTNYSALAIGADDTLCIMVDCEGKPHILYWYSRPYFIAFGTASGSSPEPNIRVKHVRRDNDGWKYNHLWMGCSTMKVTLS